MTKNALQRAIESVGNARLFAAKLNITEQSVGKWKNKYNGIVPSARVLEVFHATGVTPHELHRISIRTQLMGCRLNIKINKLTVEV